ncbi:hypothetical protein BC830DRAFT_1094465 [Chytriomyces sp. MP71]|nr:hypothetical protein BC830DRAFT_1094465 [Chytriomyces sp. MP71]
MLHRSGSQRRGSPHSPPPPPFVSGMLSIHASAEMQALSSPVDPDLLLPSVKSDADYTLSALQKSGPPLAGVLSKLSGGSEDGAAHAAWKARYFVLMRDARLYLFGTASPSPMKLPTTYLPLTACSGFFHESYNAWILKADGFGVGPDGEIKSRSWTLLCPNATTFRLWRDTIRRVIETAEGLASPPPEIDRVISMESLNGAGGISLASNPAHVSVATTETLQSRLTSVSTLSGDSRTSAREIKTGSRPPIHSFDSGTSAETLTPPPMRRNPVRTDSLYRMLRRRTPMEGYKGDEWDGAVGSDGGDGPVRIVASNFELHSRFLKKGEETGEASVSPVPPSQPLLARTLSRTAVAAVGRRGGRAIHVDRDVEENMLPVPPRRVRKPAPFPTSSVAGAAGQRVVGNRNHPDDAPSIQKSTSENVGMFRNAAWVDQFVFDLDDD